jgi:cytochrome c-type biogenesis protein CcmH/NrfG
VLTALISYLLVELHRQVRSPKQSMWQCLCVVRASLFQRVEAEISDYRRRRQEMQTIAQLQPSLF